MGIISGSTMITSISLFHITLAFFFITNPSTIAHQGLTFIIGEAMGLPHERSFDKQSAPLAFLGVVFLFLGITDIVAISLPEEISQYHWGSQAPVRFLFSGALSLYTWLFSASSPMIQSPSSYRTNGFGEGLKNRMVFTWAFLEMVAWFWVFVTMRDERHALVMRLEQKRRAEENSL